MPKLRVYDGKEWVEIAKDGIDGKDGRDGKDGQDANELMILNELVRMFKAGEVIEPKMVLELVLKSGLSMNQIQGSEDYMKRTERVYGPSVNYKFMDDETPSGTVNGVNATFSLSKAPVDGSLKVYRGGARQRITEDYTHTNKTIVFTIPPVEGEVLLCDYRYF